MTSYRLKGASGKVAGQTFALGVKTVIGSSAGCELRIEDENVAPRHVEIDLEPNGELLLQQLDEKYETRVNGAQVQRASLGSGDEIRVGNCRWVLQAPGLRPEKVLTAYAVRPRHRSLPWLVALLLVACAALAWQNGWLRF